MRASAKRLLWQLSSPYVRNREFVNLPGWAAKLLEIKTPSTTRPQSPASALGGANINIIVELLDRVRDISGDIAECGVFRGATLIGIGLLARKMDIPRKVYGLDSFQGFDRDIERDLELGGKFDEEKREGGFGNTKLDYVQERVEALGLNETVHLIPGYFRDTLEQLAQARFCFVHLDCDIYESYKVCLEFFHDRIVPGGLILLDEYNDPHWPGCNLAVDEFTDRTGIAPQLIERDGFQKYYLSY